MDAYHAGNEFLYQPAETTFTKGAAPRPDSNEFGVKEGPKGCLMWAQHGFFRLIPINIEKPVFTINNTYCALALAIISILFINPTSELDLFYFFTCIFVLVSFVVLALKIIKLERNLADSIKKLDRQHKEIIFLQDQLSLIKEISERSDIFKKALRELQNDCTVDRLSKTILKIEEDFEAFISKTEVEVLKCQKEIQQLNHKHNFESAMKDFQFKIQECARKIQEKQNILKTMKECYNEININYKMILNAIPSISDKNFMDVEDLNVKMENFKQNAALPFRNYCKEFQTFYDQVEQSDDNTCDGTFLFRATNLFNTCSKDLDSIKKELTELLKFYFVTPEGKLARKVKKSARRIKSLNGVEIFKLPISKIHEDQQHNFRHYSTEENTDCTKPFKVIMMTGMTGAGKSLMLNNILNYVYGVTFQDNFRFQLIVEDEEFAERHANGDVSTSHADSMTRWISSYTLYYEEGFRVPYTLILIDTPGFGDTRGVNFDENIGRCLQKFFNNDIHPIDELSSISFVIQASQARLTAEQIYVFNAVLNIFGNNVIKNICLLFTFADAQLPPALEIVKREKIPYPDEGVFKFNNSAVYAGRADESNAYYWKFGFDSLDKFFLHIAVVEPASLTLTKEVLKERQHLHQLLEGLQRFINDGFETLQSLENTTQVIMELKGTMRANKDFKVKKIVHPQETKVVDHNITNCKVCMFTCHDPCGIEGDNKEDCASMIKGKCVMCSGKCPWESHSNGDRIYIYTKVESEETIQEMMDKYHIALNDKGAKLKLTKKLLNDYKDHKGKLFEDIQEACKAAQRLEEIALGKSLLSSVAYLDRLIESERRSDRPNKDNRIKQLQHFKERAELLSHARTNPSMVTEKMNKYEAKVMNEIKKLEEELTDEVHCLSNETPVAKKDKPKNVFTVVKELLSNV